MKNLSFNPKSSTLMHIDLNSCFATIEQQANPHLRGKPVAVAAYETSNGCILAASVEAKRYGIKTGMRVKDGKLLYSKLIVLSPDPWKYRSVHLKLKKLLSYYTYDVTAKSIDEFVLDISDFTKISPCQDKVRSFGIMCDVAREIKQRIRKEIGDWLTVSIGIAPNRFLAKVASNLHKPDGLEEVNKDNFLNCYLRLKLTDLPYIKMRNAARLGSMGIYSVLDFYHAPLWKLKVAFRSVNAYSWYLRLRGYEIDDIGFGRRSYGNSYALSKPLATPDELSPILSKLVTKMGARLRCAGYKARGVNISILYSDWSYWHKGASFENALFDSRDIYKKAFKILCQSAYQKPVRELAVSCFKLVKLDSLQLGLFENVDKKKDLVKAVDKINEYWGDPVCTGRFAITPARMFLTEPNSVPDRISFGGVKELEEFSLKV